MKQLILASILTILSAAPQVVLAAEKGKNPDFTKGEAIPARAEHDWNLGPTGMRGWMYCAGMATTEARQIAVTEVEKAAVRLSRVRVHVVPACPMGMATKSILPQWFLRAGTRG